MDASSKTHSVTMETEPLVCAHCHQELAPLQIEELAGFMQLRAGNVLISSIEANCAKCGWKFIWKIREQDIKKMIGVYQNLVDKIVTYKPE